MVPTPPVSLFSLCVKGKLQSSWWVPMVALPSVSILEPVFCVPINANLGCGELHALHPTASAPQRMAIRSFNETMATKRINFCLVSAAQSCYLSTVQKIACTHITTISQYKSKKQPRIKMGPKISRREGTRESGTRPRM